MSGCGCVYFIQAGGPGSPIKIGHTTGDPRVRLRALQTAHPERLRLITVMPGDRDFEELVHKLCWMQRIRGEWFRDTPTLRGIIDGLVLDWDLKYPAEHLDSLLDDGERAARELESWS